ncbi:MAG: cyclase family protein [Caldilineaceae bacterium]
MSEQNQNPLSNWGRWGSADQLGCFNLLTPERIQQAARLVKTGKTYSLAMRLAADGPQWPTRHKTWRVTTFHHQTEGVGSADDVVTMHSHSGTHMDALCHVWYDGQFYNGFSAQEHMGSTGATRNSIDNLPWIVGRGVLLDIARWKGVDHLRHDEAISAADLDACAQAQGVHFEAGDILLLRTGWMSLFDSNRQEFERGEPGLDNSTLPWLKQHDIVAICADNQAIEVIPQLPPPSGLPFHPIAIRDLGLYLVENLNLEALAADRVNECLIVIAPLPLTGGIGCPVNPIAIT